MKDLSNENVIHVKKDGIEYLQFRKLLEYSDVIKHAYAIGLDKDFRTARAKNATPLTNEEYEKSVNDYKKLTDSIGIDYINIAKPNQAHTKNIKTVEQKVKKDEPDFNLQEYAETDGLVTNTKNIASALEILMFDPRNGKKYSNRGGNTHLFNANVIKYSVIPTKSRISMNFLIRNHSRLSCRFIYFSNRYPRPRIVRIYADGSSASFARSLLIQTIILLSATI